MMADPQTQAMFEAVYSAPLDRDRREVLADALLQEGAARGEFIALQLDGSTRARKRALKLLERHRAEWLGPLVDNVVAGTDAWQDGFLAAAHVRLWGDRVEEPSWATVERLVLHWRHSAPRELASPHLRSLVALRLAPLDHGAIWRGDTWAEEERAKVVAQVRATLSEAHRAHVLRPGEEWLWRPSGEWMWLDR
jgi:uncharacterized protein (TIGR02996 family)